MRRIFLLVLTALLFVAAGAAADWDVKEEEVFEQTVSMAADGTVSVKNVNGHIEVEAWDRDEVHVWAKKQARAGSSEDARAWLADVEIDVDAAGGDVAIKTELPEKAWGKRKGGVSVSYKLKVPRGAALEARSTNGHVEVAELAGTARLTTTNGGIKLRDIGGDVEAQTTNGSIEARGLHGRLEGRTTNGSIRAEILADSLREDMSLTTTNGSIDVDLSSALAAAVDARSSNGRVESELAPSLEERKSKNAAIFELNGGGPEIKLRTTNGRIRLHEAR